MVELLKILQEAQRLMQGHVRNGNLGSEAHAAFQSLVDAASRLPGAEGWTARIAQARWDAVMVYERPADEVEQALQDWLDALGTDVMRRMYAAGAAYATYPSLRPYFEDAVTAVREMPESDLRGRLLDRVEDIRANVRRKFGVADA